MTERNTTDQQTRKGPLMEIIKCGNQSADIILVQPIGNHEMAAIETELQDLKQKIGKEFGMIFLKVDDWNADLSPWSAPAVFGNEDFKGKAPDLMKKVIEVCSDREKKYIIGGYSLAGLFALWMAYQTDLFCGVAAASPSIWFPGFTDYMKANEIFCPRVYLSLGDREVKTRNPVLKTVGSKMQEAYLQLKQNKTECTFEWNTGNHFQDAEKRVVRAFQWVAAGSEK